MGHKTIHYNWKKALEKASTCSCLTSFMLGQQEKKQSSSRHTRHTGIEHVYMTLTTWWKFSTTPPKHSQSWKEVQKVLDLPELKIGNKTSGRNCTWCSISEKLFLDVCTERKVYCQQPKDNLKT